MRYVSVRPGQEPLRPRIREIATARLSYGYRRLHVPLRREGWPINGKRVHRLYLEEGLDSRGTCVLHCAGSSGLLAGG